MALETKITTGYFPSNSVQLVLNPTKNNNMHQDVRVLLVGKSETKLH